MRIRTIKPEFWTSDDVAALDLDTRLLFIGLWSYVDDHGRGRDEEHLIIAALFPRDMYERPRAAFRGRSHPPLRGRREALSHGHGLEKAPEGGPPQAVPHPRPRRGGCTDYSAE